MRIPTGKGALPKGLAACAEATWSSGKQPFYCHLFSVQVERYR